jgi:hypothetical protein
MDMTPLILKGGSALFNDTPEPALPKPRRKGHSLFSALPQLNRQG